MGEIKFTAALGDDDREAVWVMSATSRGTRGQRTGILTPEEFVKVLQLPEVRRSIAKHFTVDSTVESRQRETIQRLTERVAELQAIVDGRRTDNEQHDLEAMTQLRALIGDKTCSASEIRSEVERLVQHNKNTQRLVHEWDVGKFDNILERALTKPTLASALAYVADWDNERAVRQALCNVGPDNRRETGHGGLWDTTFEHLFTRVLDAWPELAVTRLRLRERTSVAESLWQLLDDIASQGDAIKPSNLHGYMTLYVRAHAISERRHEYLKSDGNKLTWPDGTQGEFKSRYVFVESPPPPVPMLLYCPMCHTKHIDEGEFATREHHTHACQGFIKEPGAVSIITRRCGHVWRPAIVPTIGVEALPGFINENK